MALLDFLKNAQQFYPNSEAIGHQAGLRNLAYFQPQQSSLAAMGEPGEIQAADLPSPQQLQQPPVQEQAAQGTIEDPYNLLERVFLSVGGQGAAVEKDKKRYEMAKTIESLPATDDPYKNAIKEAALKDPATYGATYLKLMAPDFETREVGGKLLRFNKNDPSAKPEVLYGGSAVDTKGEGVLRKEFNGLTTDYRKVRDAYSRVEASTKDPSPAGDLSTLFNFMKILDPGSTVREGEYATAENSGSIDTRIQQQYNKVLNGEKLTPEMRADFVNQAKNLYGAQAGNYNQAAEQYRTLGKEYGYSPDRIAKTVELPKTSPLAPNAAREQKLKRLQELKALKAKRK